MPRPRARCNNPQCGTYAAPDAALCATDAAIPGLAAGLLTMLSIAAFFIAATIGALALSETLYWAIGVWCIGSAAIGAIWYCERLLRDAVTVSHLYTCDLCGKSWDDTATKDSTVLAKAA